MEVADVARSAKHLSEVTGGGPGVGQKAGIDLHARNDFIGKEVALLILNLTLLLLSDRKHPEMLIEILLHIVKGQALQLGGGLDGIRYKRELNFKLIYRLLGVVDKDSDGLLEDITDGQHGDIQPFLGQLLLIELTEGWMMHHCNQLRRIILRKHAAQATAQRLLRQDPRLGGIGTKRNDGSDIAHVPAFP